MPYWWQLVYNFGATPRLRNLDGAQKARGPLHFQPSCALNCELMPRLYIRPNLNLRERMTLFFQQICTLENVKIPPMCFSSQKLKGLDAPYIKKNRIGNSPHRRPWILNKRNVYSIQWTTFIVIDVSLPFRHILVNCSIDYRPHVRVWRWFEPWSWRHWKEIRLPIASWTLSTHIHLSRCSTHWNERNIKRNIIKEILLKKKHLPTDETHGVKIVECKSMLFVSYAIYRQYNNTDSILCSSIIKSINLP